MQLQTRTTKFDLLTDDDLTPSQAVAIIDRAAQLKAQLKAGEPQNHLLPGKTLAMIFEKPSTRTRVSFEVGMAQMGGHALYLSAHDLQLGRGETIEDTGAVLSRYVDVIMARMFKHTDVTTLAKSASVPVINGLSDLSHPTQGLADMLTIKEQFGGWSGHKLAYVGNKNNMVNSLLLAGALVGLDIAVATPPHNTPDPDIVKRAQAIAGQTGSTIEFFENPYHAIMNADIVYTDVWVSMGQDVDAETLHSLEAYQVDDEMMSGTLPNSVFMHCLPMMRGQEVTAEIADGPQSIIYDQAENRLHVHKALLYELLANPLGSVLL
jgi:ornithine carbamoyltransferase